jgi:hypothetical protein
MRLLRARHRSTGRQGEGGRFDFRHWAGTIEGITRLPAFFSALRRVRLSAPRAMPSSRARGSVLPDDIFHLIPPRPTEQSDEGRQNPSGGGEAAGPSTVVPLGKPVPASRHIRSVGVMDLTRLSIDDDGRLYWDGKPVEIRRRITMSRAQIIGASVIGAFAAIAAAGAAIQGAATAYEWACRAGWTSSSSCSVPAPPPRTDIPA